MRQILRAHVTVACLWLLVGACPSGAQGRQDGLVTGTVQSSDRMPLPGVAVVATSPSRQQPQTTVTDGHGVYYLRGLPPGTYRVTFTLAGFEAVVREALVIGPGELAAIDARLAPATVRTSITVTGLPVLRLAEPTIGQTLTAQQVDLLPIGRRPVDIAELAPGVTPSVVGADQVTMGGGFAYDNLFMVNGVDVADTIFGRWNDLFIEDAIDATTVVLFGLPADYGRFSGGVVNVVTRSGGNRFSGSVRETLDNPAWIAETPIERKSGITHHSAVKASYEGTFGGPILRDRLWFFTAGRYQQTDAPNTFALGGDAYTRTETNRRGEMKVTATLGGDHRLQVSAIGSRTEQANATPVNPARLLGPSTLLTRQLPQRLFAARYSGGITARLFATLQYSEKKQGFRNNGGTSTQIQDSPFRSMGAVPGTSGGLFYNAPYLDANDPEDRNNRQITGSLASLWSTPHAGSHELKAGMEYFVATGVGGNSQSSTGAVFVTDYASMAGVPVRDGAGQVVPLFLPGVTEMWTYDASRGARVDITTTSFFLQDRWSVSPRLTVNAGVRAEIVRGDATGGLRTVDTSSVVPRLSASYDLQGNGGMVVAGTYGEYVGRYGQVQFAANTAVGHPSEVDYVYAGPAGQGRAFAPGFDRANYTEVIYANFPLANVRLADDIHAPRTREATVGLSRQLGAHADVEVTYVRRSASGFVEDFLTLPGGVTNVPLVGALTNRVFDNTSERHRHYDALLVQAAGRPFTRLRVNGNYTLQLRNSGDFEGEAANQPGIPSVVGDFPEIFGPALGRLEPSGRLDDFRRHTLRVFGTYTQPLGRFGSLDVSPLWRVNSGGVYSLTTSIPIPAIQLARNPGYPANDINPSVRETIFFGDRGAHDFKGSGVLDLAASCNLAVWRPLEPWVRVVVFNAFNNQKEIGWDTTVSADPSVVDANGIPTGYRPGPFFGTARQGSHFPQPFAGQSGGRAIRVTFGLRF